MRLKPFALILDDDQIFRKALETVLSRLGLNVKATSNSKDYLAQALKSKPDLHVIDLQLEDESGFDVIQTVRSKFGPNAIILVISGSKDIESIERALRAGANDYVTKPLDRAFLVSKLSKYLSTQEIDDQCGNLRATPEGSSAQAKLTFSSKIAEVDELGVKLQSKSLIPNGTVLKLSSEFLVELGAPSGECLVTVTSSWFDSSTGIYGAYAEFDGVEVQFLERLRSWLSFGKKAA